MKCLCQFDGSLRVCRIVDFQPDRQSCMVRLKNASSVICVRKEALRPYRPQKLGTRHLERAQMRNIEQSLGSLNLAHKPANEGTQPPASINEAPARLDANAQMLMTMPVTTQNERVDWQTAFGPMGSPMHQFNPSGQLEAAQSNMAEQSIVYG
uniref:Uncharacterized protein n=1 Tax=Anopheles atroparvus TaxID=41427 RepID=A0AAG5DKL0_ANOAO